MMKLSIRAAKPRTPLLMNIGILKIYAQVIGLKFR